MKITRRASLMLPAALLLGSCSPAVPVSPGTWEESARIVASSPVAGEQFGHAVALSSDGGTLAVGVPLNSSASTGFTGSTPAPDDAEAYSSGAVYVYARSDEGWIQAAFVKASNRESNDQFGSSVALSGDGSVLAVSAPFEDGSGRGVGADASDNSMEQSGAVYVFSRTSLGWTETAYVKASNTGEPAEGDTFGYAMALSRDGGTLAVGAPGEDSGAAGVDGDESDNSALGAGAVYVFGAGAEGWSQRAYLKSSASRPNVLFGYAVAVSGEGDRLAVGAYDEDQGRGAVYVFERSGDAWSEAARLQASNGEPGDSMGAWVDISDDGNTIAAGAADEDSLLTGVSLPEPAAEDQPTDTSAGAAYVFGRSGADWSQEAFIKASNAGHEDWFGLRLALSGDGGMLGVGAPNEDGAAGSFQAGDAGAGDAGDDAAQEAGAVYTYSKEQETWMHHADVKGVDTGQYDEFGGAVALSGDGTVMAVGARYADSASVEDSGAVYVFSR